MNHKEKFLDAMQRIAGQNNLDFLVEPRGNGTFGTAYFQTAGTYDTLIVMEYSFQPATASIHAYFNPEYYDTFKDYAIYDNSEITYTSGKLREAVAAITAAVKKAGKA